MKNSKGVVGLGVFVLTMWVVVVATYSKQVQRDGQLSKLLPMENTSCSSSTSTSSSGE